MLTVSLSPAALSTAAASSVSQLDLQSASPWLQRGAFASDTPLLRSIAESVDQMPLAKSALVKAYSPRADCLLYTSPSPRDS